MRQRQAPNLKQLASEYGDRLGPLVILLILIIVFTMVEPFFLTRTNLGYVGRQVAALGIVAVGQTIVIISAGIDLSVGSVVALTGVAAARVLEERNLVGKVKLVAFDASDAEIAALERGSIQALVAQNPFRMGYDGVTAAVKALEGEFVEKRIDTGVTIIAKDDLNDPEVQEVLYSAQKEAEAPGD